jgi:hypothetical protein
METIFNYLLLYYLLNNSIEDNKNIIEKIINIIETYKKTNKYKMFLRNFIIIVFHKRQFKNDNLNFNSKTIFYETIIELYDYYPKYIDNLVIFDMFAKFGYYKDYLKIWECISNKIKNESDIEEVYKKYNNLILNISYILIKNKSNDIKKLDFFIKQFSKYNEIFKTGYLHFIELNNIELISNFMNLYNTDYYCDMQKIKKMELSNIGKWLPRENKSESKKIFWYRNINGNYLKFNCFDYLVLVDNILFKNKSYSKISSMDKKLFRKESSLLNICLNNPTLLMCEKKKELINFYKSGSKFIFKNYKSILYKNNNKNVNKLKTIYSDMKNNMKELYDFNNLNIYKYNLTYYLNNNNKKKKKINNLFLDYKINIENYDEQLENFINDIYTIPEYIFIPII